MIKKDNFYQFQYSSLLISSHTQQNLHVSSIEVYCPLYKVQINT